MSTTYQQAAIPVQDPEAFGLVRAAITDAFSASRVSDFLRGLEREHLRIRDFEPVLDRGVLGAGTADAYAHLAPGDQGQIRELYLALLEHVAPELRTRFFKLYAYY